MRTESSRGWRRVVHVDTRWETAAVMRGVPTPLTNNAAAYDIREVEMGFDLGTDTRGAQADTRWGTAAVRRVVTMPLTNNVAAYDIRWLTAVARYMRAKTPCSSMTAAVRRPGAAEQTCRIAAASLYCGAPGRK